ncbi:hypothetical protein [Corallococcus llansteffanensis]|uniref:Uncharacterized protein n=1 Tax=Corallococcus llansteffanensis TaxID=2316731 RepID=A0A3A8Q096_9BACT|nr:hypothetical protein [Corallococcus llansteffanensis]RKH62177.1 hypothetical protein D7V93_10505 [Corallococcus llansteffanensis]
MTRPLLSAVVILGLLPGCSLFGYYKYERAPRGTPEEAERIDFPDSYAEGIHLRGPELAAFIVALNEFIPPHSKADTGNEALTKCLTRRDTYDATLLKASDDLYFVSFLPKIERCGIHLDIPILDAGADYAIDRNGRILGEL